MIIYKIIAIGIIGAFLTLLIKQYKPEIAPAIPILTGIAVTIMLIPRITSLIEIFRNIAESTNADISQIKIVIKIIGVAYLCQFASDICKDAGESSISGKIELGGKLVIISLSAPIIYSLLELTERIIKF